MEREPLKVKRVPRRAQQSAVGDGFTITQFQDPPETEAQMRRRFGQNELHPRLVNLELNKDSRGYRAVYPQVTREYLAGGNRLKPPHQQNLMKPGSWSQPLRNNWGELPRPEGGNFLKDHHTAKSGHNIEETRHFIPNTTASTQISATGRLGQYCSNKSRNANANTAWSPLERNRKPKLLAKQPERYATSSFFI